MIFAIKDHKVASRIIGPLKFLPLNPIVNKFGNIEGCGYNMHQFGLSILTLGATIIRTAIVFPCKQVMQD